MQRLTGRLACQRCTFRLQWFSENLRQCRAWLCVHLVPWTKKPALQTTNASELELRKIQLWASWFENSYKRPERVIVCHVFRRKAHIRANLGYQSKVLFKLSHQFKFDNNVSLSSPSRSDITKYRSMEANRPSRMLDSGLAIWSIRFVSVRASWHSLVCYLFESGRFPWLQTFVISDRNHLIAVSGWQSWLRQICGDQELQHPFIGTKCLLRRTLGCLSQDQKNLANALTRISKEACDKTSADTIIFWWNITIAGDSPFS